MTERQLHELRVNRATSKVQTSDIPLRVKCLVCNIIKLKLALLYGQQRPYERRQHIHNMRQTLREELGK